MPSRVLQQAGTDQQAQIEAAFALALGRRPDGEELAAAQELLAKHAARLQNEAGTSAEQTNAALASLCQMLLNTNEFLYVP